MQITDFENIEILGEMGYRILKSFARLHDREYRPEVLFHIEKNGWAGDWEGRTLLALVLLSRITGKKALFLDVILERLGGELNERGYLKGILSDSQADEQQLSGHSWLLRGLLEHYLWTGEERSLRIAKGIVEGLYLPRRALYDHYPLERRRMDERAAADGNKDSVATDGWYLSTDIGCAFMSLDGLSQYYAVTGDERVRAMLETMIRVYMEIDFVKASMQTHASLSACRGILRYYQCTRDPKLLSFVSGFMRLYSDYGMTENYANFNWFGRPLWTEPCGFIDSFILATELWRETRDAGWLAFASRVYQNAFAHGQRSNGGFGCDDCVGPLGVSGLLAAQRKHYEAHWCCTMRGAEGLSWAARAAVMREDQEICVTLPVCGRYRWNALEVFVDYRQGEQAWARVRVQGNQGRKNILLYVPDGADRDGARAMVQGTPATLRWEGCMAVLTIMGNGEIEFTCPLALEKRPPVGKTTPQGLKTFWRGDRLLGVGTPRPVRLRPDRLTAVEEGRLTDGENLLETPEESIYMEKEALLERPVQILFDF